MTGSNIRVEYDLTGHKIADIHVFSSNYSIPTNNYQCHRGFHSCSHLCLPNWLLMCMYYRNKGRGEYVQYIYIYIYIYILNVCILCGQITKGMTVL